MIIQENLFEFINKTIEQRNKVVLGLDANNSVRSYSYSKRLEATSMDKLIIRFHKNKSPPTILNRNKTYKPIDSIWRSCGVEMIRCNFLPFHNYKGFDSDQRLVWVNFCNETYLRHGSQRIL